MYGQLGTARGLEKGRVRIGRWTSWPPVEAGADTEALGRCAPALHPQIPLC